MLCKLSRVQRAVMEAGNVVAVHHPQTQQKISTRQKLRPGVILVRQWTARRHLIDAEVEHTPILRRLHIEAHDVASSDNQRPSISLHHQAPE